MLGTTQCWDSVVWRSDSQDGSWSYASIVDMLRSWWLRIWSLLGNCWCMVRFSIIRRPLIWDFSTSWRESRPLGIASPCSRSFSSVAQSPADLALPVIKVKAHTLLLNRINNQRPIHDTTMLDHLSPLSSITMNDLIFLVIELLSYLLLLILFIHKLFLLQLLQQSWAIAVRINWRIRFVIRILQKKRDLRPRLFIWHHFLLSYYLWIYGVLAASSWRNHWWDFTSFGVLECSWVVFDFFI